MYPNLDAEMSRKKITQFDLIELLDKNSSTISLKITGKRDWKLPECKKIRKSFFSELSLDYLFKTKEEIEQESKNED